MKDSKSFEVGLIPTTPIRFTRDYELIVDRNHPEARPTPNPHCHVWDKPLPRIWADLGVLQYARGPWDYLEFYSPNPIPGTAPHLGHELNLLIGHGFANLLKLPPHSWINDLGLNFCKGLWAYLQKIPYAQVDGQDRSVQGPLLQIRQRLFHQGLHHSDRALRDKAVRDNDAWARQRVDVAFTHLYQSDYRQEMRTLMESSPKDALGRPVHAGIVIGTSGGLPLYAASDICYRTWLHQRYRKPILLVGKDQEAYHRTLHRVYPIQILTNPCVKTQGRKVSKRKGDNVCLDDLLTAYRATPCTPDCGSHRLSHGRLRTLLTLDLLLRHHKPVVSLEQMLQCTNISYWNRLVAHSPRESMTSQQIAQVCRDYPRLARHWSYLPLVVQKSCADLNPGFLLKYIEVADGLVQDSSPTALDFHRMYLGRALRVLLGSSLNLD